MDAEKSIVFDLDHTICFPHLDKMTTEERYGEAEPNREVIEYMRTLKELGFYITIHSSRRMITHKGNLAAINDDVYAVTAEWLRKYSVPFDRLVFGKPYSTTWYVDDKAMTPEEFINCQSE